MRKLLSTALAGFASIYPFQILAEDTDLQKPQENLAGAMDCEVKSNTVLAIRDGIPRAYSGFKDGFDVGDHLRFEYEAVGDQQQGQFILFEAKLIDSQREDTVISRWVSDMDRDQFGLSSSIDDSQSRKGRIRFGPDYIELEDDLTGKLKLWRYYGSDWDGLGWVSIDFPKVRNIQTFTLDCRTLVDEIDKIVDEYHTQQ